LCRGVHLSDWLRVGGGAWAGQLGFPVPVREGLGGSAGLQGQQVDLLGLVLLLQLAPLVLLRTTSGFSVWTVRYWTDVRRRRRRRRSTLSLSFRWSNRRGTETRSRVHD